jgi:hypothetical protein
LTDGARQSRPLEPTHLVILFDAPRVKIRGHAVVRNKAVFLARVRRHTKCGRPQIAQFHGQFEARE